MWNVWTSVHHNVLQNIIDLPPRVLEAGLLRMRHGGVEAGLQVVPSPVFWAVVDKELLAKWYCLSCHYGDRGETEEEHVEELAVDSLLACVVTNRPVR